MDDTFTLIFSLAFSGSMALLGIIILITGILNNKIQKKKEANCTSKTYGKIIDIVFGKNADKSYSTDRHPVIEYNVGEHKYVNEYPCGTVFQSTYFVGQEIEICYNPENPEDYYIAGDKSAIKDYVIFAMVFIIAAIISAVLVLFQH